MELSDDCDGETELYTVITCSSLTTGDLEPYSITFDIENPSIAVETTECQIKCETYILDDSNTLELYEMVWVEETVSITSC